MRAMKFTEKEREELERASEEEREWIHEVLISGRVGPQMRGDMDLSLMTFKELMMEGKCRVDHERIVRKRAEELRFFPDTLTREERDATLSCLTYEELKPFWKWGALHEKNIRLQTNLSLMEKIDVRIYQTMTLHFSEFGPCLIKDPEDIDIGLFTERYFIIMRKHGEKVYEKPYYFLMTKHKKRVLEAYAKFILEEGDTKKESPATEFKASPENTETTEREGVP